MYSFLISNRSVIRTILGSFLTAALVLALMQPACASEPPPLPEGMRFVEVPFQLVCAERTRLNEIMMEVHQEVPMVAGAFDSGVTWIWYVNEENTTASFVVVKNEAEACLIFSGVSVEGNAVVPNLEPQWPIKTSGPAKEWNT